MKEVNGYVDSGSFVDNIEDAKEKRKLKMEELKARVYRERMLKINDDMSFTPEKREFALKRWTTVIGKSKPYLRPGWCKSAVAKYRDHHVQNIV